MGQRANFVVIRDGQATAYYDAWAAMGCTYFVDAGPESACEAITEFEAVDELMEWSYAEAGYLIDSDEKTAIIFGCAEDTGEDAEPDGDGQEPSEVPDWPFVQGGLALLQYIARNWSGWKLVWDDRGVDAFAAHLRRRSIAGITVQPDSHPPHPPEAIEYQA